MIRLSLARRGARGQAVVEFALVLPFLVLLFFGLIDVGRAIYIGNAAAQAAREGARWGSVQGRAADAPGRASVEQYTLDTMNAVPSPVVSVSCERNGLTRTRCTTNDILIVTVESPVQLITPLVAQLIGPVNVSATSKVVVNQ